MGNSNERTVSTELGEVIVHKMALNDYAELLSALDKLPKNIGKFIGKDMEFSKMKTEEMMAFVPQILAESWSDIVALIAVPTDKDAEFLGKLDAADAVDIILAIFELNDFARIANAVKKLAAIRIKINPADPKQVK